MAEVDWHAVAIVVLGCPLGGALTRRLERAVQLFCDRAAPILVLSGGGCEEAEYMRYYRNQKCRTARFRGRRAPSRMASEMSGAR